MWYEVFNSSVWNPVCSTCRLQLYNWVIQSVSLNSRSHYSRHTQDATFSPSINYHWTTHLLCSFSYLPHDHSPEMKLSDIYLCTILPSARLEYWTCLSNCLMFCSDVVYSTMRLYHVICCMMPSLHLPVSHSTWHRSLNEAQSVSTMMKMTGHA